jgi:hypothetical protein
LKRSSPEKYDIHLITKALFVIREYHCRFWKQKKLLYFSEILDCIKNIMGLSEMSTTREASELCNHILRRPEDMVLWLKFANENLLYNSACTDDFIV